MKLIQCASLILSLGFFVTTAQGQSKITATASSAQPGNGAGNAVDGNPNTFWHTPWQKKVKKFPHYLRINLGQVRKVYGIVCIPRQGSKNGLIKKYELYASRDGKKWSRRPIYKGEFLNSQTKQEIHFKKALNLGYIKLKAISSWEDKPFASLAEVAPIYSMKKIPFKGDIFPIPRRARSVHLSYTAPTGRLYYNEVIPTESHTGTYFCVCGFNMGYFGMQEKKDGQKVIIFSVWEPSNLQDESKVKKSKRVQLLYKGKGVKVGRFGGEGTGGQSFFKYDWKVNKKYRFMVKATTKGAYITFTGYFYLNKSKKWKRLVTFKTLSGGKKLSGYYSFIEDFKRNTKSYHEVREAKFGNGWVKDLKGNWIPLYTARFTGDELQVNNVNAGTVNDNFFFLQTGGKTKMTHQLRDTVKRTKPTISTPDLKHLN